MDNVRRNQDAVAGLNLELTMMNNDAAAPGSDKENFVMRRDLSRYVFAKECAIRIDKQQKERL